MDRRITRIAAIGVLVAVVAGAVLTWRSRPQQIVVEPTVQPSPEASPQPRPRLGYTPVPDDTISPVVIGRTPARGAELTPDGAVELVFDRAMDHASVESSFKLLSAAGAATPAGAFEWADARTLRFKPAQPLPRAALFDVALNQGAKAQDGAPLNGAYQFRFATTGFLEVGQVIPADGAQDVQAGSTITVLFNRPVVPLAVVEQQGNAPQPLAFEPAIAGSGEWLSTAIYVFHPSEQLPGGTAYTGRVDATLKDVDGNPLQSAYTWRFTTAPPQVVFATPPDGATQVSVEPAISLQFNQQIDEASARASFHLRSDAGGDIPGTLQVVSATLTFTPETRLEFDQGYRIEVAAGLTGRSGGIGMQSDFRSSFRTVPLPRILGTTPANGDTQANPYTDFSILFNTPIDPDTVMANIQVTPPLSPTQVYTYFDTYANTFHLNFGVRPSTDFAVQIGPNIADPYGNTTGQSLDVRFSTAALPPSVQLLSAGMIATYNAQNPARIGISAVNMSSADLSLYRLQPDDLTQIYQDWNGRAASLTPLRRWQPQLNSRLNENTLNRIDLVEGGGRLDPGVYLLLLDQPQGGQLPHILVVSSANLTLKAGERDALVWANDLQSGQPIANLAVDFYDEQAAKLGSAITDANGIAQLTIARTENRGVLAIARQPFAAVASSWNAAISPWEFGLPGAWDLPEMAAHIYTDRPIYRPGQTVEYKGVLRADDDVHFSLPANLNNVQVTIRNTNGEQLDQQTLPLSQNGTFGGNLKLADGAALGPYYIELIVGQQGFNATFQVAAYRPPEFQVTVTPNEKEIVRGTATSATAEVTYFFGGPVANAPVTWNVLAETYRFAPEWAGRYQFNDNDDPWRCFDCWWFPSAPPQPILSGSGTTDAQGKLTIAVPADLKDTQGQPITGSLRLSIEASATGRDNQVISGRGQMIAHAGRLYVGLAPRGYLGNAGEAQTIDLVTADTQAKRLPNQTVDVEVVRITWQNTFVQDANGAGHWEWKEQRTTVDRQSVTTDSNAEAAMTFTPAEGGSYRVAASARDAGGNTVRSSLFVWVAGDNYVNWRRDNNDRISLIADKTTYNPGETASILIPSPFTQPHWALITVERGTVLSHEVRRVEGNSIVYQLPLTAEHAPNVYVSAVLFSPPDAPGKPADYKTGVLPLAVAPDAQTLRVTLTPSSIKAEPGQSVRYDVQVTDLNGQPVAAELSLDLVDKAVLSLLPRTPDAIREAFYARRSLGIVTASGMSLSADRFQQQFEKDLDKQRRENTPPVQQGATTGNA